MNWELYFIFMVFLGLDILELCFILQKVVIFVFKKGQKVDGTSIGLVFWTKLGSDQRDVKKNLRPLSNETKFMFIFAHVRPLFYIFFRFMFIFAHVDTQSTNKNYVQNSKTRKIRIYFRRRITRPFDFMTGICDV